MVENKVLRLLFAWILRLALPIFIFYFNKNKFMNLNITDLNDLVLLLSLVLAILIIIGNFLKGQTLTRISSFILFLLIIFALIKGFAIELWIFPIFVALYFWIYGNNF